MKEPEQIMTDALADAYTRLARTVEKVNRQLLHIVIQLEHSDERPELIQSALENVRAVRDMISDVEMELE